jgi:hypothetical protein
VKTKTYRLGAKFPHEGYVQSAIEAHFLGLGFTIDTNSDADLLCAHSETGERWLVEAKGVTSAIGLDFRTGLGQLVQRMTDASVKYGIAVPEVERFLSQCRPVSSWVRERLGLHWLLVSEDGSVRRVAPSETL